MQNIFSTTFLIQCTAKYKCIRIPNKDYHNRCFKSWSLTLREERTFRIPENRVVRKIFVPKEEEAVGSYRKLHNQELHNSNFSPNIIGVIKQRRM
jgi:hypothetical protein